MQQRRALASTLTETVLLLVAAMPLILPFGLVGNIGLQAMLVTLTGILAWLALLPRVRMAKFKRSPIALLLGVYILASIGSVLGHPGWGSLFGTTRTRLGAVELIACIGIGLALRAVPIKKLTTYLYGSIAMLALVSLPYSHRHPLATDRLGGTFYQPDFLAVIVAVGLLLGLHLWQLYPRQRVILSVLQAYLLLIIFLTQTRAVIAILCVLLLLLIVAKRTAWRQKIMLGLLTIGVFMAALASAALLPSHRLGDAAYASSSTQYRIALQTVGFKHLADKPLTGYGAADLSQPLACNHLTDKALTKTCQDGYYFNSSHNVFLDRFLALGWLGGLCFVGLVLILLARTLRTETTRLLGASALLITLYYLTNIPSITIELLLWICLFRSSDRLPAGLPVTVPVSAVAKRPVV